MTDKERLEEIAYNVGVSIDGEKALMSSDDYDFLYNYALEQAERVEEMGKVEYALQEMYRQERQYNERLEKENQRLKQALEEIKNFTPVQDTDSVVEIKGIAEEALK